MGTNLLSRRLKELEQAGLIQQLKLPPPASATVYTFTHHGRKDVLPIIQTLTNFGVQYLQYPPQQGYFVPASSTMGALSKFYKREQTAVSETVQFHIPQDAFYCQIDNHTTQLTARFGLAPTPSTLTLRGTPDMFMGLVVGYVDVKTAVANGSLHIEQGDETAVEHFFVQFTHNYDEENLAA